MRFGVRFWPPSAKLETEVHWALLRAFGPVDDCGPSIPNPTNLALRADQLGVLARIFGRCSSDQLQTELPGFGNLLAEHERHFAKRAQAQERLLKSIESVADRLQSPYAVLDFAALGESVPNSRRLRIAQSVDIVVAQSDSKQFQQSFRDRGLHFAANTRTEGCTSLLFEGTGDNLNLHDYLRHVRMIPGGEEVTLQQLLDSGRTSPVGEWSKFGHIPGPDLLLAHAMARGIAQFGFLPRRFPLLQMLADAIDLDIVANPTRATQALWWVQPDVTYHEVTALRELAKLLLAGKVEQAWADETRNGRLLRHMVLGALNDNYAAGLLAYQTLYRAIELKRNGIPQKPWPFIRDTLKGARSFFSVTAAHGHPLRQPPVSPLRAGATALRMFPSAALMAARQVQAFSQLVLGTKTL